MSHLVAVKDYSDACGIFVDAARRRALFYPVAQTVVAPVARPVAEPKKARVPIILRELESRNGRVWTEAEVAYLRQLVDEGKTLGALSLALRRTQDGVRYKCECLKIRVETAAERSRQDVSLALSSNARGERIVAVINAVSRMMGVSVVDIKSDRRSADCTRARWAVAWLLRTYSPLSLPLIGAWLGGRDHTTIINAFRRFASLMANDPVLDKRVRKLGLEVRRLFEAEVA